MFLKRCTQALSRWAVTSSHSSLNKAFPGYTTEQQLETKHWALSHCWWQPPPHETALDKTPGPSLLRPCAYPSKNYMSAAAPQITMRQIRLWKNKRKTPKYWTDLQIRWDPSEAQLGQPFQAAVVPVAVQSKSCPALCDPVGCSTQSFTISWRQWYWRQNWTQTSLVIYKTQTGKNFHDSHIGQRRNVIALTSNSCC